MNSEQAIIKGKIDNTLNEAFKKILSVRNLKQQEFIEQKVKEFVLENIHLIINSEGKSNKE